MNLRLLSHLFSGLIFLVSATVFGQENTVRIPLNTLTKPALDLVSAQNQSLSLGELKVRFDQNQDLSTLNPFVNKFWQGGELSSNRALDPMLHAQMPDGAVGVTYTDFVGAVRELGLYAINVRTNDNQVFRLKSGLQVHASLLKAALLRKIGIFQESPRYYQSIKVKFSSKEQMDDFVERAFCVAGPNEVSINCLSIDPDERGFLSNRDDVNFTMTVHGAYLEKLNPEVPSLFDGLTPSDTFTISLYAQSRAYRALVVPYVLGDVGESVNRYSAQSVAVRNGIAFLNYGFSADFNGYTGHDDVKWILREISKMSDADWDEVVQAASYPAQLAPLVKAKLLHRYKNMMETFFSRSEKNQLMRVQIPPLNISSGDGVVVDGKVMTQEIPGYPQRFSHGERTSPFESGDFGKYIKIRAQSTVIDSALDQLSRRLSGTSINQELRGIDFGPNGVRPIISADVVQYGLNASANRIVTTGTYYGSDAAVQMVDSLTVAGSAGYMHVLDGMNSMSFLMGGGVSLVRNYTHVMPIASMREADQVPLRNLYVPSKLKALTSPLKDGKLTEFLQALKVGEVFTITDSIGLTGQIGINTTIDALTAFAGVGLSVGISADGTKVIMRQIQFVRTSEGLQVYVRNQNSRVFGLEFNVNYFINLLRIRAQTTNRDIRTKVYLLNYNASLISQVDNLDILPDEQLAQRVDNMRAFGNKAALALRSLLRDSSTEALDTGLRFQRFEVEHDIQTTEMRFKLLWFRSTKMKEEHLLTLRKTEVPVMVNGVPVVNQDIQIVTYKKGRLKGKDPFGFGTELLDGVLGEVLGGNAPRTLGQESQNPSQMPFGRSHWTTVRTDTELTQNRPGALPSVAVIQNVWGGWSLNRRQLNQIIEQAREKTNGINFADYPLVPTGALATVEKIDFYRITAHMSILPEGLRQIKQLMLSPAQANTPEQYTQFMDNLVVQMSERFAPQNRVQDRTLFSNLIKMIGNGDEVLGRELYMKECERQQRGRNSIGPRAAYGGTQTRLHGTSYECLSDWVEDLIKLSRKFPVNNLREQNKWLTDVIYVLDRHVPQGSLMNFLGQDKFLFYLEVTGFRSGDEDGDEGVYVSNVYGESARNNNFINGLISALADKSRINVTELEQNAGGM